MIIQLLLDEQARQPSFLPNKNAVDPRPISARRPKIAARRELIALGLSRTDICFINIKKQER